MRSGYFCPPRGSPIHTATAYCGVKPENHVAAELFVVPVFAAAGRSPRLRPAPVPLGVRTPRITSVTAAATYGEIARRHAAGGTGRRLPVRSVTDVIPTGVQAMPPLANVA